MVITSSRKTAPHNEDAERNVLGACLLHPAAVRTAAACLSPADFWLKRHGLIFDAILEAHEDSGATDPIVVGEVLARRGRLEEVGGHPQLLDLLDGVVTAVGVELHANIVLELAERRRVAELAQEVARLASSGDDFHHALAALHDGSGPHQARHRPILEFHRPCDLAALPARRPIWRNYFCAGDLVMPYGPWGSCKSFFAMALAAAMADGLSFLGHEVAQGLALLVCGEGAEAQVDRLRAATAVSRVADPDDCLQSRIRIASSMPPLTDSRGFDGTVRAIDAMDAQPQLLIVDTFSRATAACGLDENSAGDMGKLIGAFDRLRNRFPGMAIMPIHHSGYGATDRSRGSSALPSACDVTLRFEPIRVPGPLPRVRLTVEKLKDGRKPPPVLIDFVEVVVRTDDRGEEVRSLRIGTFTVDSDAPQQTPGTKFTARDRLRSAMEDAGPGGISFDEGKKATSKANSTVSDAFSAMVDAGEAEPFEDDQGKKRWRFTGRSTQ